MGSGAGGEATVRALVERLASARDAAEAIAGRPPLGLRAVEARAGRSGYLCAFEGPAFLCLTGELVAERDPGRARETTSAGLLWELLEALVDAPALRDLASRIARLLALGGDPPQVAATLQVVAARALELAAWREAPERAVASLAAMDQATGLQDRLVGAYGRFVRASEPLVQVQDALPPELVEALREVEEAGARAGALRRLAEQLAAALPECDEGADQVLAAHLTRLR